MKPLGSRCSKVPSCHSRSPFHLAMLRSPHTTSIVHHLAASSRTRPTSPGPALRFFAWTLIKCSDKTPKPLERPTRGGEVHCEDGPPDLPGQVFASKDLDPRREPGGDELLAIHGPGPLLGVDLAQLLRLRLMDAHDVVAEVLDHRHQVPAASPRIPRHRQEAPSHLSQRKPALPQRTRIH